MPLVRRTKTIPSNTLSHGKDSFDYSVDPEKRKVPDVGLILFLFCGCCAIVFAVTMELRTATKHFEGGIMKQNLEEGVILSLEMNRNDDGVTLGPHKARVAITQKSCPRPRIWMRCFGDALLAISLDPENDDTSRWSATFAFPVDGTYQLEARWYGCDEESTKFIGLPDGINFFAKGGNSTGLLQQSRTADDGLFPTSGFWLSREKFVDASNIQSPYVWVAEDKQGSFRNAAELLQVSSGQSKSTVAVEGNPVPKGFHDLSNYELVCWVGSESAERIRDAFLSLRPSISANQRPFKFHYYPLHNLAKPDIEWEGRKGGFRKCKNVLISVDELKESVSQSDYKNQVEYFINQVIKCLHDETFPIWMLSVNIPPMVSELPKLCHSPQKHTHNHPCNDALFDLFDKKRTSFPHQVKLLDNTDLSDAHFDQNSKDIYATIAMRIFSLVGKQVEMWRSVGQKGIKEGLMRNGTLEPNMEQEDYVFDPLEPS